MLDWKTEWTPEEKVAERTQEHWIQMAVYAKAVERLLEVMPGVELCFLSPMVRLVEVRGWQMEASWVEYFDG